MLMSTSLLESTKCKSILSYASSFMICLRMNLSLRIFSFQNVFTVRTSRLKSKYLLQIVAVCGFIAYVPLIVWQAMYPVEVEELTVGNSVSFCWVCVYPGSPGGWVQVTIAELVTLVWCALLIFIAALLAYKVRI